MKIGKYSRENGFTLAEVLITLGIIGVVAAMTIPTLMQNTQNSEFKAAFKKEYSILNQATSSMLYDNGGTFIGLVPDDNTIKNAFKNYLKYSKDCDQNSSGGVCWHSLGAWKSMDNTSQTSAWGNNRAALVLNDGSMIEIASYSADCTDPSGTIQRCGNIYIDVNGFKNPNQLGRDVFAIFILKNRLAPVGVTGDGNESNCGSTKTSGIWSGNACAGWIIQGKDY